MIVKRDSKKDLIGLYVEPKAYLAMAMIPIKPRGELRSVQRLVRIKRNLFRELESLNKEIKRHPSLFRGQLS